MAPTSDLGELEVELSRLLRRARSAQQRTAADVHPDLDSAGYAVLVAVRDLAAAGGGARGGDISDVLGLHKSTTSRNLTTLGGARPDRAHPRPGRRPGATGPAHHAGCRGAGAVDVRAPGTVCVLGWPDWDAQDVSELARLLRLLNDTAP